MLGAGVGIQPQYRGSAVEALGFPSDFAWDQIRFPIGVKRLGPDFASNLNPRDLVDLQIWTGTGVHVDSAFTRNGKNEPNQPVAIVGWGGAFDIGRVPFQ